MKRKQRLYYDYFNIFNNWRWINSAFFLIGWMSVRMRSVVLCVAPCLVISKMQISISTKPTKSALPFEVPSLRPPFLQWCSSSCAHSRWQPLHWSHPPGAEQIEPKCEICFIMYRFDFVLILANRIRVTFNEVIHQIFR